jgi:hypothetical protein
MQNGRARALEGSAIGPMRGDPPPLHATPAFDQVLELLPKLLPAELELLIELKKRGERTRGRNNGQNAPDAMPQI